MQVPIVKHINQALNNIYIPASRNANKQRGARDRGQGKAAEAGGMEDSSGSTISSLLKQRVCDPRYGQPGGFPLITMAPEGTTSNGTCLLTFRTGAFLSGRPLLPILFHYHRHGHNPAWTFRWAEAWG